MDAERQGGSTSRAALGWALVAGFAAAVAAPLDPNLLEEGIVVHTAERMLGGEHLYRDVVSHTGPLPYELLALLFRLFGADLAVARGAMVALHALAGGCAFGFARRAGAGPFAHAFAAAWAFSPLLLAPHLSTWFYTNLAMELSVVAVFLAQRSADSGRAAVATGTLVAAIALCKQNTGVYLAATLLPAALLLAPASVRLRTALAAGAGAFGTACLTLLLYALRGDLADFVFGQVELPLAMAQTDTFRTPLLNLWPPGVLAPAIRENWPLYLPSLYHIRHGLFAQVGTPIVLLTQALYALPFAALAAGLWRALRGGSSALWLHGALLVAMTANLFPRADWGHLVVALPAALAQLLLLPARRDPSQPPRGRFALPLAAGATALLGVAGIATGLWLRDLAGPATFGPRVPLRPISDAYRQPTLPRVIAYLRARTRPGDAIFVPRQEPLLYFATETRNPTRFAGVFPAMREAQQREIVDALRGVRFVAMSDIDQPIYTYYGDELPAVQRHLERHFRIAPDFPIDDYSWMVVLARGPDRGAAAVDLLDARPAARAFVRDGAGRETRAPSDPPALAARQLNRPLAVWVDAGGGGIDYELEIPPNAVFQAGVGFRGLVSVDHRFEHPRGITLALAVRREGEASFETLREQRIDDDWRAGRRWLPFVVDLGDLAGQSVTLRLDARSGAPLGVDRLVWWGSPRIAIRPQAGRNRRERN